MYNVSGEQSRGAFLHVKYGHTWRNTHVHTHNTHTHTYRGPWQDAHKLSATPFKMGTLRPREEPPHTLRLNTRARARASPDAPDWAHQGMPGHRVWSRAVAEATDTQEGRHCSPERTQGPPEVIQPVPAPGSGHSSSPTPALGTPFPTREFRGANLGRRAGARH